MEAKHRNLMQIMTRLVMTCIRFTPNIFPVWIIIYGCWSCYMLFTPVKTIIYKLLLHSGAEDQHLINMLCNSTHLKWTNTSNIFFISENLWLLIHNIWSLIASLIYFRLIEKQWINTILQNGLQTRDPSTNSAAHMLCERGHENWTKAFSSYGKEYSDFVYV